MKEESPEKPAPLRSGYTTGACATATAVAAAHLLVTGDSLQCCTITLPKGQHVEFAFEQCTLTGDGDKAIASTIKDAGDDPDVTHGALVFSEVELCNSPGVTFKAADGVGTVTKSGLPIPVGQPAINPVPRKMIDEHLRNFASTHRYTGGFVVSVGVENGEHLATKTMNPRLGIVNGLSILGTTGIVRPFSCSAYIASIQQGIDVALSNQESHLFACTGNRSEEAAIQLFSTDEKPMNDGRLIEMGDFVGAVLKHVRKLGDRRLKRLTIIGGFGKLSKFAQQNLDLHSKSSSIDFGFLSELAAKQGANADTQERILQANTSIEALQLFDNQDANTHQATLANAICALGVEFTRKYCPSEMAIDVIAIDKQSQVVGSFSSLGIPR
ncbi:cobalt-precorrin-5B (C(1))-methyltransferase [Gammaproteobacteria bacterium 45_16_T64]|nr:cobalt-precorrin-5B (C(1))-methyltransferase [Gammaproteobacteria bacterium 45_16_T64]